MKHLILIGDGMADYPQETRGGLTPLELARTPSMDRAVQLGLTGLFCPIPDGLPPGSDVGNLSLFGYNPRRTFTGRAPLEAASQGIALAPGQVAFRCNLVTVQNGIMDDFAAGHISSAEARELILALDAALGSAFGASFHPGVSYRHLTIITPADPAFESFDRLVCTPPHDIIGQPIASYLPRGPGAAIIRELMDRSQSVLQDHPVNQARIAAGQAPATSIWLWGQGRSPAIEPYATRFGLRGAVISAVDLVKGIGACAGLEIINVPGATGYLDTNYAGKVAAAQTALEHADVVYLHVEAPDEASHTGRLPLKLEAIEAFDQRVVAPCLEHIQQRSDTRLIIAPDHVTALSTRTHATGAVPFAVCGAGVQPGGATAFNERAAAATGLLLSEGHELVPFLFATAFVTAAALKQRFGSCQTTS